MTLDKDQPKEPMRLSQKIIWAVTLIVAVGGVAAAIILGVTFHVNIFASH